MKPARCAVVGAGLAGAAVASSFARRGWQVEVLDAAGGAAQGASALPAGVLAPHQSVDDNLLSKLTRAGVAATWAQARALLVEGVDWSPSGVLENRQGDARSAPALGREHEVWTRAADAEQKREAGLPADANAWWHERAAWIRPGALVRAWLGQPGIVLRTSCAAASVENRGATWEVHDVSGRSVAQAEVVVIAAALGTASLLSQPLALTPVRGQVSWSHGDPGIGAFPLNGNGHFIPRATIGGRPAWLTGSTYGRGDTDLAARDEDHDANLQRLRTLCPVAADRLGDAFAARAVHAWTGIRCTSIDRRPLAGWLSPGLGVCTAMGSRGLTFAALCAELLAATLHGEPLPLAPGLAQALDVRRVTATRT
ncbi:FAD-dependent 5-carboxymethylaminomethyl-2-thiouridine(34) oxidoreductase MnmC [Ramlibacter sp.]|uniref:FAD-dependent 5-carboxymethylaminomethyl-2-thiouridine(34) oxidoreductase MnmC n=1 Tax=Ramlibacter sp. TaxID=1917967 RepID=UPI003D13AC30